MTDRLRAVRHRFAAALLPPLPAESLGEILLLPHQRQATARLLTTLQQHRGALLADAVGLGKTFTALAVAHHYGRCAVIAPAPLLGMWRAALLRTRQPAITVHSLHQASVRPLPTLAPAATDTPAENGRTLVIIDEAHALRNPHTVRYRHIAHAITGCDVLLLSATPLHNRPHDLAALFALFRGHHAQPLHESLLASLVVRREQLPAPPTTAVRTTDTRTTAVSSAAERSRTPTLRCHRPHTVRQDSGTLERLIALPAPLPTRHGAAAGALIRLGLLRAWCSSDAALTHAITRRIQRAAALRAALSSGRHPTTQELHSWLLGDDATDMQLGFPELLVQHALEDAEAPHVQLDTLDRHATALHTLRDHHAAHASADARRAAYVRQLRERHRDVPIVAFSQHTRTVQALFRALADIAGVGLLTSRQARIASGPVSRTTLLEAFAPRAHGRPPPPTHQRVTLLLATDLIAEGVNLQDAGVVLHLDLPWTHALRTQRTGRVVRIGSPHPVVEEYRLRSARHVRTLLQLEARVARKAALAARYVGSVTRRSAADLRTRWLELLDSWMHVPARADTPVDASVSAPARAPRLATWIAAGAPRGALVLLQSARGAQALAVVLHARRAWVSDRPEALLALADGRWPPRSRRFAAEPRGGGVRGELGDAEWPSAGLRQRITRAAQRWLAHQRQREVVGLAAPGDAAPQPLPQRSAPAGNGAQQRAWRWLHAEVSEWSAVERQRRAVEIEAARACIAAASGAGCEDALRRWCATTAGDRNAVGAWRTFPELVRALKAGSPDRFVANAGRARMVACVVVVPPPE